MKTNRRIHETLFLSIQLRGENEKYWSLALALEVIDREWGSEKSVGATLQNNFKAALTFAKLDKRHDLNTIFCSDRYLDALGIDQEYRAL